MTLRKQLQQQEEGLAQLWLDRTLRSYSSEGAKFMAKQKDRFANPVGHALRVGIPAVVGMWLARAPQAELARALEPLIRIRSVQNLTAGQAVAFVLLLKSVMREQLGLATSAGDHASELFELDSEVDQLLLVAFDVYSRCRAEVYQLRVDDVKRRVSGLLRRVGWGDEGPPAAEPARDVQPT